MHQNNIRTIPSFLWLICPKIAALFDAHFDPTVYCTCSANRSLMQRSSSAIRRNANWAGWWESLARSRRCLVPMVSAEASASPHQSEARLDDPGLLRWCGARCKELRCLSSRDGEGLESPQTTQKRTTPNRWRRRNTSLCDEVHIQIYVRKMR